MKQIERSEVSFSDSDIRSRPLLIPAAGLVGGIIACYHFPVAIIAAVILCIVSLISYALVVRKLWLSYLLLSLFSFSFGIIHFYLYNYALSTNHIKYLVSSLSQNQHPRVLLFARVVSSPMINKVQKKFPYHTRPTITTQFIVQAEEIHSAETTSKTTGLIQIYLNGVNDALVPGQHLRLVGRISKISQACDSDLFAERSKWFLQNRIFATMSIASGEDIEVLSHHNNYFLNGWVYKFRQTIQSLMMQADDNPSVSGLMNALILGRRNKIENQLNDAFIKIGAAHLLAVSGFHLAILTLGIWMIALTVGLSRKTVLVLIIITAWGYLILTDARASIVRATIMITLVCLGYLRYRRIDIVNSICAAGLIMLIVNPNQLFSVGFQLSFVSLLGIVLLHGRIYHYIFASNELAALRNQLAAMSDSKYFLFKNLILSKIKMVFCVSLAAAIAAMPLVMIHFNITSLLGPISSILLLIPAALFIFAGFGYLLTSAFLPIISGVSLGLVNVTGNMLTYSAMILSKIPGAAFYVAPPSWLLVGLYYLAVFWPRGKFYQLKTKTIFVLLLICCYLTGWIVDAGVLDSKDNRFLYAAGFSDGQTVAMSNGKNLVLIDCGSTKPMQARQLVQRLDAKYLIRPACVVITTPNQRFFNDLWSIYDTNPKMPIFIPSAFADRCKKYQPVDMLMNDNRFKIKLIHPGDIIRINGLKISVLADGNTSGSSAILLAELADRSIMIAPILTEQSFLTVYGNYRNLKVDTIICNSQTYPCELFAHFLKHIKAKKLIVCGRIHPHRLKRFRLVAKQAGVAIYFAVRQHGLMMNLHTSHK